MSRFDVQNVPAWMISKGVGHVIAGPSALSGWARWACGVDTPYATDDIVKAVPQRVCSKCRKVLAEYKMRSEVEARSEQK